MSASRVVDPDDVVGETGRRSWAGTDAHTGHTPRLGATKQIAQRIVDLADRGDDVTRSRNETHLADEIVTVDEDGRQGTLADDDRMYELDGQVATVRGPSGSDAPHGRLVGEPSGESQSAHGEIGG